METKPLYRSWFDSFDKDFYVPVTNVISAPVVTCEADSDIIRRLLSEKPPQSAILYVNADLMVTDKNGAFDSLYNVVRACTRTLAIFYIDSMQTAERLSEFVTFNNICDASLCASYKHSDVLKKAYEMMPMLRCMLDFRGYDIGGRDILELAGDAFFCGATMIILPVSLSDRKNVHALQNRLLHIWCEDSEGIYETASKGVNGIITSDVNSLYYAYQRLPENSMLKTQKLLAHKGFQNNGEYSENTITAIAAAGEYSFDGTEIDIMLTSDDVAVVMHNQNTDAMFEGKKQVIKDTDYKTLSMLRRKLHPDEGLDRFDDLMRRMADYPQTPVMIEIKTSESSYGVEEMTRQMQEILSRPDVQKHCTCIMGDLPPYLGYVHKIMPRLPLTFGTGMKNPPQMTSVRQIHEHLFRFALTTQGWACGYSPEDTMISRLFNEYAKIRGINVVTWSRSWFFAPSKWEENGIGCDATYLSGYDGWITDHGEMYLHLPTELENTTENTVFKAGLPERGGEGALISGRNKFRDGRCESVSDAELFIISGEPLVLYNDRYYSAKAGRVKVMQMQRLELHFGGFYYIYSEPFELIFE